MKTIVIPVIVLVIFSFLTVSFSLAADRPEPCNEPSATSSPTTPEEQKKNSNPINPNPLNPAKPDIKSPVPEALSPFDSKSIPKNKKEEG